MLRESVENQAGIESIARSVMAALSLNYAKEATEFMKKGGNSDYFDISKISNPVLGQALKTNKATLSPELENFVKERYFLNFDIQNDAATRKAGQYISKKRSWWDDDDTIEYTIVLVYEWNQMALRSMIKQKHDDLRWSAMGFAQYLKDRYTTLVHELVHAFDDWRSKGKDSNNKASISAKNMGKIPIDAMSTKYPAYTKRALVYSNNPIEINARFYQTIADIGDEKDIGFERSWKRLVEEFENRLRGWSVLPPSTKVRLLKRLAIEYSHRRAEKIGAIDKNVSNWTKRLCDTEGVVFEAKFRKEADVVALGLSSITDEKKKNAVLESWKLFGSIFRKTVVTNDLTPQEAAMQGFVKNAGKKKNANHSFTWFREPRS